MVGKNTLGLFIQISSYYSPQRPIRHPGIDFRRGDLPMPQRPLDEVEVAGFFIQAGGEGVAEGVDRNPPVDTRP